MDFKKFLKIWFWTGIFIIILNLLNLFWFTNIDVTRPCPGSETCTLEIIYLSNTLIGHIIIISLLLHFSVGIIVTIFGFLKVIKNRSHLKIMISLTILLIVEFLLLSTY